MTAQQTSKYRPDPNLVMNVLMLLFHMRKTFSITLQQNCLIPNDKTNTALADLTLIYNSGMFDDIH